MLLLVLVCAALLAVTLVLCFRLMLVAMTRAIERRHRAMETILESRRPPDAWLAGQSPEKAKRRSLRRLDRLIDYARHSRLVESDETRRILLGQLGEIREEWSEATSF